MRMCMNEGPKLVAVKQRRLWGLPPPGEAPPPPSREAPQHPRINPKHFPTYHTTWHTKSVNSLCTTNVTCVAPSKQFCPRASVWVNAFYANSDYSRSKAWVCAIKQSGSGWSSHAGSRDHGLPRPKGLGRAEQGGSH